MNSQQSYIVIKQLYIYLIKCNGLSPLKYIRGHVRIANEPKGIYIHIETLKHVIRKHLKHDLVSSSLMQIKLLPIPQCGEG